MTAVGLLCAVFAVLMIAHTKTKEATRGLSEAEAFLALVTHIEREIRGYRTPLSEILRQDGGILETIGFMDEARAFVLSGIPPVYRGKALTKGEKDAIDRLFSTLGSGTAEEEERRCRQAMDALRSSVEKRKSELPREKRLYRVSAISLSLMLLILFI